jgi:two-component system sensor histidine kinase DesK
LDSSAWLAIEHERARISRDLHDLLGHNLFLIALSADIAGRHLGADQPGGREIRAIEHLARETMRVMRQVASGAHHPTLEAELAEARAALEIAGIELDLCHSLHEVPPELEGVLAWTVREGVTNVIRHSRARHCRVLLGGVGACAHVDIVDDGAVHVATEAGSGLCGLRERVAAVGGQLVAGPLPSGGYRLRATLPGAGAEAPAVPLTEAGVSRAESDRERLVPSVG